MKKSMKDFLANNFLMFFFFAILGWLYEMGLFFVYGTVDQIYNRGFLKGPYLPIYGFGMLILIALLNPLIKKLKTIKVNMFLIVLICITLTTIITSSIELIASYMIELAGVEPLWDYSEVPFNFQGRISLNHSLRFGFGGTFFLLVLVPFFRKFIEKTKYKNLIALIIFIVILIDFIIKVIK